MRDDEQQPPRGATKTATAETSRRAIARGPRSITMNHSSHTTPTSQTTPRTHTHHGFVFRLGSRGYLLAMNAVVVRRQRHARRSTAVTRHGITRANRRSHPLSRSEYTTATTSTTAVSLSLSSSYRPCLYHYHYHDLTNHGSDCIYRCFPSNQRFVDERDRLRATCGAARPIARSPRSAHDTVLVIVSAYYYTPCVE